MLGGGLLDPERAESAVADYLALRDACETERQSQKISLGALSDSLAESAVREADARKHAMVAATALNEVSASRDAAAARAEAMSAELSAQFERVRAIGPDVRAARLERNLDSIPTSLFLFRFPPFL